MFKRIDGTSRITIALHELTRFLLNSLAGTYGLNAREKTEREREREREKGTVKDKDEITRERRDPGTKHKMVIRVPFTQWH